MCRLGGSACQRVALCLVPSDLLLVARYRPQGCRAEQGAAGEGDEAAEKRAADIVKITHQQGSDDAAQTAGLIPIDVQQLGIDMLATSGHKSLLGPLGTGLLYLAPGLEHEVTPLRFGGTGTKSDDGGLIRRPKGKQCSILS